MLDHADHTAATRQHELDHTDHTDHTDQDYICPEGSTVDHEVGIDNTYVNTCLLYTSPSPRDKRQSRMPSSA